MRRDDRDDPFDDIFREIERMMNDMMGGDVNFESSAEVGFGVDTHVDVHDRGDDLRVVADLPGIEKDDIDLKCDGTALTIRASTGDRSFDEHVTLPTRVDEHTATATFNNGVLEVALEKADDSANIDVN